MKPLRNQHRSSLLMSSAAQRLVGALALIALLWMAVAWALTEPMP